MVKVEKELEKLVTPELVNRARSYLIFIFKDYGTVFYKMLTDERFSIVNLYIRDMVYEESNRINYLETPLIYLKLQEERIKNKKDFYAVLKSSRYFRDTYYNSLTNGERIFVFDVMREYWPAYYSFLRSEYSKMYSKEQLKSIGLKKIVDGKIGVVYCVLHGLPDRYDFYKSMVIKTFNPSEKDIPPVEELKEFDIPWTKSNEILNYKP